MSAAQADAMQAADQAEAAMPSVPVMDTFGSLSG